MICVKDIEGRVAEIEQQELTASESTLELIYRQQV